MNLGADKGPGKTLGQESWWLETHIRAHDVSLDVGPDRSWWLGVWGLKRRGTPEDPFHGAIPVPSICPFLCPSPGTPSQEGNSAP